MYKIIKDVLDAKKYNLSEITRKIEKRCMEGSITEEQRDELLVLANQNASAENEKASSQNQLEAVFLNMGEFGKALKALTERVIKLEGKDPEESEGTEEEITEEYPLWKRWNGIGLIPYQKDSKCTHNGVKYISVVDNNFWEPGAPGVHENIWKKVEI